MCRVCRLFSIKWERRRPNSTVLRHQTCRRRRWKTLFPVDWSRKSLSSSPLQLVNCPSRLSLYQSYITLALGADHHSNIIIFWWLGAWYLRHNYIYFRQVYLLRTKTRIRLLSFWFARIVLNYWWKSQLLKNLLHQQLIHTAVRPVSVKQREFGITLMPLPATVQGSKIKNQSRIFFFSFWSDF